MATISSGSVTFTINAGEQYRVIATGEAYVDIGGGSTESYRLINGASERLLGGFIVATPVTIRVVSGSVEYINVSGTGDSVALSLAQSSRTDITGVVASTASGNVVFPDGVSSSVPFVLYDSATEVICPNNTSNNVLVAVTIPAALMRKNSVIRWRIRTSEDNNANTKTLAVRFGGGVINCYSAGISAVVSRQIVGEIENLNSRYHQRCTPINVSQTMGSLTQAWVYGNVDTTNDQLLTIELKKATAADYFAIQSVYVEVLNANV